MNNRVRTLTKRNQVNRFAEKCRKNTVHSSLRWPLLIAAIFGLMPVCGIFAARPKQLFFSWYTWRTLYSIVYTCGLCVLVVLYIYKAAIFGTNLYVLMTKRHQVRRFAEKCRKNTVHTSLRWPLLIAAIFGLMPVCGIFAARPKQLFFSWYTWRTLYSIVYICGLLVIMFLYIYRAAIFGINLYSLTTVVFYVCTLLTAIMFLKIAREWPTLMQRWEKVEILMVNYGRAPNLNRRLNLTAFSMLSAALIEYILTRTSQIIMSNLCKGDEELFKYYFTVHLFSQIFTLITFSLWKGLLLHIVNAFATFAWTFGDLFIVLISSALAVRFQQITTMCKKQSERPATTYEESVLIWRRLREDYNCLSQLTKQLNRIIGNLVLLSFASNLFFILTQLFNSLRVMKFISERIYFFYSFAYLIVRIIAVCIYGGWIFDESKRPLIYLYSIRSDLYNIEVKRFIEHIKFDQIAISGHNFFKISPGLFLSITGAIFTYELVFVQLNEDLLVKSLFDANSTSTC